jgi:YbgC/YbaW family acyl-CoA thioester hydrolase
MLSRLSQTVRSTEVDFLGHVNNAKYQEYLEWGRFQWFRDAELTRDRFGMDRLAPVVVHVALDYRSEAQLDDELTIETALTRIGDHSLHFRQRVVHRDGRVACDGRVVLAMFDLEKRAAAPVPAELRAHIEPTLAPRYGEE